MNYDRALLRKYEDSLNGSGLGVIILGAWSVIRALIELFLEIRNGQLVEGEDKQEEILETVLIVLIVAVIAAVIMKIHIYIGLNAVRAARGQEYKKGYFVITIIYTILSILFLSTYKEELSTLENLDTTIASIIVDLTTIYLLADIIIASLKIRKLKETDNTGGD